MQSRRVWRENSMAKKKRGKKKKKDREKQSNVSNALLETIEKYPISKWLDYIGEMRCGTVKI